MGLTDMIEEIPRKTMVLFFLVDTSGSMTGTKIGAVNTAIEETIPEIVKISNENADAELKIATLEFSAGATWITSNGPVPVEDYTWNYQDAGGVTDLGIACDMLNEKLSRKEFMREATGSFAPAIILLSDGGPTDDWQSKVDLLKQNNWFKKAIKIAIAIGNEADKSVLEYFTGNSEAVIEVHNAAMLKKLIKIVSIRSSEIGSRSTNVNEGEAVSKSDKVIEIVQDEMKNTSLPDPGNSSDYVQDDDDWDDEW